MLVVQDDPGENLARDPRLLVDGNGETMIAVCNISEKFTYEEVDTEITMDGKKKKKNERKRKKENVFYSS